MPPTPTSPAPFAHVQRGLVAVGTVTSFGIVEQVSLTAYLIGGEWVSFDRLHGRPAPVMPLVTLDVPEPRRLFTVMNGDAGYCARKWHTTEANARRYFRTGGFWSGDKLIGYGGMVIDTIGGPR